MHLTYFDSNSWLIELEGKRILLDPWLVGDLTFGGATWLFKGSKNQNHPIPENIDLILLSQGLEDHAHPPTLEELDKNIPVLASPKAAKVVEELGYKEVNSLKHGESYQLGDNLEIKALVGSPVGPNTLENAYFLKGLTTDKTIYYEPHGYHGEEIKKMDAVDVVITPIINLKLPLLGAVIKGQKTAIDLCKCLEPQVILSTAAGGDVSFEGILLSILKAEGTVAEFANLLKQNGLSTLAIDPRSGEQIELSLV